jgi:outer membrane lipoprotein-sorting protein
MKEKKLRSSSRKELKLKTLTKIIQIILIQLFIFGIASAQESAEEIMKKSHLAFYYAGDDGAAEVKMLIGESRVREFTMLRLDIEEGGKQMYYTYFKVPHDVSRLTFMVHKVPFETDQRWLYVPAVDLIKRIAADDKTSSFVGSDFTYEDVSGRHWSEDNHTLKGEQELNGRKVYVIESVPKEAYSGFSKKISFIDMENFIPLKEEYFNAKDELERVFTAEKVEVIEGLPTATLRKMENVKKGQATTVEFKSIDYNIGLTEKIFTERYLKNPPREYIK